MSLRVTDGSRLLEDVDLEWPSLAGGILDCISCRVWGTNAISLWQFNYTRVITGCTLMRNCSVRCLTTFLRHGSLHCCAFFRTQLLAQDDYILQLMVSMATMLLQQLCTMYVTISTVIVKCRDTIVWLLWCNICISFKMTKTLKKCKLTLAATNQRSGTNSIDGHLGIKVV